MSSFSPSDPVIQPHSTISVGGDDVGQELKHYSIDLSMELERQLELESSPPRTPTSASTSIHSPLPTPSHHQQQPQQLESLDPHVLAHIVAELRKTIEDMTKERNDLLKLLDSATMREASLQDTLQLMTEKATDYEEELSEAKKKIRQDEDDISLLRHKVEESRRGLMRLQTESRRQSAAIPGPLDLSRASIPGFSGPPTSKRASFTPLTGRSNANGHRRVSSISVDGSAFPDLSPNPNDPGLAPPSSSRRSLFKYSPPTPENVPLPSITPPVTSPEIEMLKKEVESLKKELSDTRAELSEANEGKEASELCVQALRGFIEENQVGEKGGSSQQQQELALKLPPTPLGMSGEEEGRKNVTTAATTTTSGWGFKLWKGGDSTVKAPVVNTAVQPLSSAATSPSSLSSSPPAVVQPTPTASAPFSRLGGFFSSRTSSSSVTTAATATTTNTNTNAITSPNSSLQTNAAISRPPTFQRDSISGRSVSVSDASSVVEPVSPEKENHDNVVKVAGVPEVGDGEVGGDGVGVMESGRKEGMDGTISTDHPSANVIG
ncbi:hypothetical protein Agabi119p4_6572 [Agaricus bisporus var. burnettii]|uniref:Uncharacterized protein n=1 Tax=Agaricus bisporus var. burnettii TaxID=192524 RepID=A0A8H7CAY0_AGABI|nr:hypothetical protein Agabi119p4_6572 [Agaricus bisporus var. burnettii]